MSAKKERTNPILAKHPMRIASPAVGQPVSGTVRVQVTASDDSGITEVLSWMPHTRHGVATGRKRKPYGTRWGVGNIVIF